MGKKLNMLLVCLLGFYATASSSDFGITFKGFIKTDAFFDTRQTVTVREGHFLLYPDKVKLDAQGNDVNDGFTFNMLSIQTRLTGTVSGPDAFGAATSGVMEGAFFGHSNGDVNGFRLRHAFVKLQWEQSALLVGQYWHPMFITEVFPGVISFNTGVPFQPFSRNPQIRWIHTSGGAELTLVAASQRDFTSTGPKGDGSVYLRNSAVPILDANVKFKSDRTIVGAGVNFKSLKPRLITENNYKSDSRINSISTMAFARFNLEKCTVKIEGVYGDNLTDLLMLGGYGVTGVNEATGEETYTNIRTLSTWGELIFGDQVMYGLFAGYTRNLGSKDNVNTYYSRGNTIASVMRVSPRIACRVGNTQFAAELEYTLAAYGTPDSNGVVKKTKNIGNLRALFSAYLFF